MAKTAEKRANRPKRVTASYLENSAVYYLQRFDSTAENLRRVLERKVRRATAHPEANIDFEQATTWIQDVVEKMQRLGYVDDSRTARIKARGMLGRGTAPGMIRKKLQMAGAAHEAIDDAMQELLDDNGENISLKAAVNLAKRRRLGPFRPDEQRLERRDKDLAALARSGFDFDTARQIIDAETVDELLERIDEGITPKDFQ